MELFSKKHGVRFCVDYDYLVIFSLGGDKVLLLFPARLSEKFACTEGCGNNAKKLPRTYEGSIVCFAHTMSVRSSYPEKYSPGGELAGT